MYRDTKVPGVSVANMKIIATSKETNYNLFLLEGHGWIEFEVDFSDPVPQYPAYEELVTLKNKDKER